MNTLVSIGLGVVLAAAVQAADPGPARQPAADPSLVYDSIPIVQHWALPTVPADAAGDGSQRPAVRVRFIVDATGKVTGAHLLRPASAAVQQAVLTAVQSWTFLPAQQDSKVIAYCLDAAVPIMAASPGQTTAAALPDPSRIFRPSPVTEAKVESSVDADYPDELTLRKLPGVVQFSCAVDTQGHCSNLTVTYASNVAFVRPAMDAVAQWKVTPAKQGDLPKVADLRGDVTFNAPAEKHLEILAANFVTGPDGGEPSEIPVLESAPNPVWPYEDQMAGQTGDAAVKFTIGINGAIDDLTVAAASKPEFGQALAAAVALWHFDPAAHDGQSVAVPVAVHWNFGPPANEDDAAAMTQLVQAVKSGQVATGGLDHQLRPVYRMAPVYPKTLSGAAKTEGQATIKFVIAPDGRVRLPQIASATQPEFGAMAAAAVSQWLFEAPTKGGKPTSVSVQVPFKFAPPSQE